MRRRAALVVWLVALSACSPPRARPGDGVADVASPDASDTQSSADVPDADGAVEVVDSESVGPGWNVRWSSEEANVGPWPVCMGDGSAVVYPVATRFFTESWREDRNVDAKIHIRHRGTDAVVVVPTTASTTNDRLNTGFVLAVDAERFAVPVACSSSIPEPHVRLCDYELYDLAGSPVGSRPFVHRAHAGRHWITWQGLLCVTTSDEEGADHVVCRAPGTREAALDLSPALGLGVLGGRLWYAGDGLRANLLPEPHSQPIEIDAPAFDMRYCPADDAYFLWRRGQDGQVEVLRFDPLMASTQILATYEWENPGRPPALPISGFGLEPVFALDCGRQLLAYADTSGAGRQLTVADFASGGSYVVASDVALFEQAWEWPNAGGVFQIPGGAALFFWERTDEPCVYRHYLHLLQTGTTTLVSERSLVGHQALYRGGVLRPDAYYFRGAEVAGQDEYGNCWYEPSLWRWNIGQGTAERLLEPSPHLGWFDIDEEETQLLTYFGRGVAPETRLENPWFTPYGDIYLFDLDAELHSQTVATQASWRVKSCGGCMEILVRDQLDAGAFSLLEVCPP